mmetsp:Transcript_11336/g.24952  ORF Transcript_11336/g.24952 Transcript_11336/m.24952 type:complete len:105 (-) Transcript_11336:508-822(-)
MEIYDTAAFLYREKDTMTSLSSAGEGTELQPGSEVSLAVVMLVLLMLSTMMFNNRRLHRDCFGMRTKMSKRASQLVQIVSGTPAKKVTRKMATSKEKQEPIAAY